MKEKKPAPTCTSLTCDPLPDKESACNIDRTQAIEDKKEHFFRQVNIEFLVHELKDPVSVIETGARMLLERQGPDGALTPFQQRTVERMLRNAQKTRDMLAELLEIGRAQNVCFHCRTFRPLTVLQHLLMQVIETNDPELYERMKTIHDITRRWVFLSQNGIRLDVTPTAENLAIHQDEVKFSQIAVNLIKNGFSYRRRHLLIHLACQHDCITISVRDDGPGIAPCHHEEIFQRYKQVAPCAGMARSGHGLGLAVSRLLARSMGGDVLVESELGQGALFLLKLPVMFVQKEVSS